MQRELITFEVDGQVFGLDIMAIREIRAWTPVTRLPRVPSYVAGVVNLRGTVLPVIDLAARLGWERDRGHRRAMPSSSPSWAGQASGLIVDSVSDIVTIAADSAAAAAGDHQRQRRAFPRRTCRNRRSHGHGARSRQAQRRRSAASSA